MDVFNKIFSQTFWQLIGKAVTSFSTILILGIISRSYGESGTGVLTLALTYLAFFSIAVDFGINAHLLERFLGKDITFEWRKLLGLRILLALLFIVVCLFGILLWPGDDLFKQLVFIGAIPAILEPAIFVSGNIIFQAKFKYNLSVLASSVGSLTTLFTIYLISLIQSPVTYVMGGYVAGWILLSFITLLLVSKFIKNISPIFDGSYALGVLKSSWPISLTLLLNVVYFRVDTFILSLNKGFVDVGIYNMAYQIFQASLVLPTFIMNGFYPILLKEFSDNKKRFLSLFKKAVIYMGGLSVLGLIIAWLSSSFIIGLITGGKGFLGSADSLKILSLGYPAYFLSSLLIWVLVVLKRYKEMGIIYLIGLLVNILLNYIYIPRYSYIASSYITGISEYLILVLQIIILWRVLKVKIL